MGFFEKIKNGLKKTRAAMANTLGGILDRKSTRLNSSHRT